MSIKKLQDLLNTGAQSGREFNPQNSRSPSFGQSQFSPLGNNFGAVPNRSPSYTAIPGVHNMFYNPASKPQQQEAVCPSPMFQIPTKKNLPPVNSIFQGSRFTAAETNPSNNQTSFDSNNISNSLNSLMNQLQTNVGSQPKNLEELLQRSFSVPSNSQFQSPFVSSSTQSPFMHGNKNNHNSNMHQPSMQSDLSKILNPMTLLETSLQNNNFLSNQNGMNQPQNNEAVNKTLVLQLAQILKQESESKIKSAIAELILKYRALGLLNNLSGTEMLDLQNLGAPEPAPQTNNGFQFQQSHQEIIPQQNVPLSNGLSMNTVIRNDLHQPMNANMQLFKPNLQPTRVDATRRELFAMSEPPVYQSADHFQPNMMQGSLFHSNQGPISSLGMNQLPISPVNALDHEMNSLTLHGNLNPSQFTSFGITSIISAPEKMEDLANDDLSSILKMKVPSDEDLPGVYNKHERISKILKYKNKIRKWRAEHPVKRNFKGRSTVAGQKPRIKGKFVTQEEYAQYLHLDCKKEFITAIKEEGF